MILNGGPARVALVDVVSAIIIVEAFYRKKLVICNISDTDIYLARSENAALNAGILLPANGGILIDEPDALGRIYTGPWSAIASAGPKIVTYSEDA